MQPRLMHTLSFSIAPTLAVSLVYYALLGHRRDYLGHYAAGYGGTLIAIAVVLAIIPEPRFDKWSALVVLPCTVLCIAAGTVTEMTVFRLAKFDEIDYCNQNLGAVLAGLATIHLVGKPKTSDVVLKSLILVGAICLLIGAYFAVT